MSVGGWLKDNQHWVGMAGILIGAAISIFTWATTRQAGEITLKFNTVKIAEAGVPGIKILDKQNNPITGNVFGCELVIWNTGNLSLGEKEDRTRQPLTVTFTGRGINILDATVQDTKNVAAGAIKLDRHDRQITVGWSQFDPGDAIKIFVIYARAAQSPITYSGRFLLTKFTDASSFEEEQPGLAGFARVRAGLRYDLENHPYRTIVFGSMAVALAATVAMVGFDKLRESKWSLPISIGILTILFLNGIVQFFDRLSASSPFP